MSKIQKAQIGRAANQNDQLVQPAIKNVAQVGGTAVTDEDFQTAVLSQIKQIIFGLNPGNFYDDFSLANIKSLEDLSAITGQYRAVANVATRNALPASERVVGMLVRTNDTGDFWTLGNDLTTWTLLVFNSTGAAEPIPGPAGEDGVDGEQGPPGATGPQGLQGVPGVNGVNGIPGINGEDGLDGDPGVPGPVGATGPQGIPGIAGAVGIPGPAGEDGIEGEPGPIGPTGPQGLQGVPGVDGINGIPGINGEDGLDGEPGPVGATGPQGVPGINGIDGVNGIPGINGEDGIDGEPGVPGPAGPTGPRGPQGLQGVPGVDGEDGEIGPMGPPGPGSGSADVSNILATIGTVPASTNLAGLLTNIGNYYPFVNLPSATPTVVDALNILNSQIGIRSYTGPHLSNGQTVTQSLQALSAAIGSGGLVATHIGQVVLSLDGVTLTPQLPLTSASPDRGGWLINKQGYLLVTG